MKVSDLQDWLRQFDPLDEVETDDYSPKLTVSRRDKEPPEYFELNFDSKKAEHWIFKDGAWNQIKP